MKKITFKALRPEDRDPMCPYCERSTVDLPTAEGVVRSVITDENREDPSTPVRWMLYHRECWEKAKDQEVRGICAGCHQTILRMGVVSVTVTGEDGVKRTYHHNCEPRDAPAPTRHIEVEVRETPGGNNENQR